MMVMELWRNQSETKFSEKSSRTTEMQAQTPLRAISNPLRDNLIGEYYPYFCNQLRCPMKISECHYSLFMTIFSNELFFNTTQSHNYF